MGQGYLLNQFISPLSNKRRDDYGGSAANRVRFPAEILAAVKQAVGDRIAVLAKINLFDGVKGGATVEDGIVTARALEAAGADMLVMSGGRNIESSWVMFWSPLPYDDLAAMQGGLLARLQFRLLKMRTPKSVRFRELYFLEAATRVRAAVGTGLGYLGGVQSLGAAQQALDTGFDAVVMARALVHDPALVATWQRDGEHRSGCTACNRCVAAMYGPNGTHCVITANAIDAQLNTIDAGEEFEHVASR
jgi:2,4-dienoyl-CoA reductase-like NADH-dependent reductase (Old Yellow Enzyme family)